MSKISNIDLTALQNQAATINPSYNTYSQVSQLSDFGKKLDKLKTVDVMDTSQASVKQELIRYYDLVKKYMGGSDLTESEKTLLNQASANLSKYHLTSEDYLIFRDALIEVVNYLNTIFEGQANGIYSDFEARAVQFSATLNSFMNSLQSVYNALDTGSVGKLFPVGSINLNHCNQEIKDFVKRIENSNGLYVDRSGSSTLPNFGALGPHIVKVI
ncbi:MAG: hypothetical protein ACRC37_01350 [Lentisphaeria bacterium]